MTGVDKVGRAEPIRGERPIGAPLCSPMWGGNLAIRLGAEDVR